MFINKEDIWVLCQRNKIWLFHPLAQWALLLWLYPLVPYSHLKDLIHTCSKWFLTSRLLHHTFSFLTPFSSQEFGTRGALSYSNSKYSSHTCTKMQQFRGHIIHSFTVHSSMITLCIQSCLVNHHDESWNISFAPEVNLKISYLLDVTPKLCLSNYLVL